jgi:protein ImuB
MSRIACLLVPLFPLAARLRSEPELKGEAVAIFEGNGNAARVVAASRAARRAGIEPGMTLPQARALIGKLVARSRDRECERAAEEALLEIADSFSPRVESAGDGVLYMDLDGLPSLRPSENTAGTGRETENGKRETSGLPPLAPGEGRGEGRLPGSTPTVILRSEAAKDLPPPSPPPRTSHIAHRTSPEAHLAREILATLDKSSLPARAGVASSKLAARVAAGLPETPTVVPPGEEAAFLAPLSLDRLSPELEMSATLARWGVRSIGELARLPEGEVASRLGESGRELHAIARGLDPRPIEPRLPPLVLTEGMELEWPLVTLEPFLFLGNAALERLAARLDSQGLACARLELSLRLDLDGHDARAIALPAPTRDTKTLLTLVRLELEARPPGAAVTAFSFTARPDKPRRAQLTLFGPPALSPDRLATTIARLASMLGPERVGSPRAVDGHLPERFTQVSYAPPPPPSLARPPRTGRGLLAVRVLRPPIELEVLTSLPPLPAGERRGEGDTAAIPAASSGPIPTPRLLSITPVLPEAVPRIEGKVRVAAGPWCLENSWWSDTPADREYWDVELSDGALYRIYKDCAANRWFADGIYD